MHSPREERALGGGDDAADVGAGHFGVEGPAHADAQVGVIDHDPGEPWAEAEQPEEAVVPAAVVDREPDDSGPDIGHAATVPRAVPGASSLWALGVTVAAARYWFSHQRVIFHMAPDEAANLAMARWLSGSLRWNMFDHSTWRPGMSVLMAPLFWFTDDTATIMHGGLLIGAALGGIAAALLARLGSAADDAHTDRLRAGRGRDRGRRPVALGDRLRVGGSGRDGDVPRLASAAPQVLRPTELLRSASQRSAWRALGFTGHSRLLPLLATVAALVLFKCVLARTWGLLAALAGGDASSSSYASFAFATMVFDAVWDDPAASNTVNTVLKRLPHVGPTCARRSARRGTSWSRRSG